MQRSFVSTAFLGLMVMLMVMFLTSMSPAQSYHYHYLVSNQAGKAAHTDPLLTNPWGLAYGPGAPFWVSDNASGWSTLYDGSGNPQSLQVVVPPSSGTGHGTPTGIVYNGSQEFKIMNWTSAFIFATLDGTISGWSHFEPNMALIGARSPGSVYTGLAITNRVSGNLLYAADSANNRVDVYDGSFNLVSSMTFPAVPSGFAPFNVQDINNLLYVTFASTSGGSGGFVYVVHEDGSGAREITHSSALNQPWGIAIAPSGFGPLSGALLVGNNTANGTITGFNPSTGKYIGKVTDLSGSSLHFSGLWGFEFGGGTTSNGQLNHLYFAAGPSDTNGYFGVIWFRSVN
jgi:uncharacterized protein (TIGR03118 family)